MNDIDLKEVVGGANYSKAKLTNMVQGEFKGRSVFIYQWHVPYSALTEVEEHELSYYEDKDQKFDKAVELMRRIAVGAHNGSSGRYALVELKNALSYSSEKTGVNFNLMVYTSPGKV